MATKKKQKERRILTDAMINVELIQPPVERLAEVMQILDKNKLLTSEVYERMKDPAPNDIREVQ